MWSYLSNHQTSSWIVLSYNARRFLFKFDNVLIRNKIELWYGTRIFLGVGLNSADSLLPRARALPNIQIPRTRLHPKKNLSQQKRLADGHAPCGGVWGRYGELGPDTAVREPGGDCRRRAPAASRHSRARSPLGWKRCDRVHLGTYLSPGTVLFWVYNCLQVLYPRKHTYIYVHMSQGKIKHKWTMYPVTTYIWAHKGLQEPYLLRLTYVPLTVSTAHRNHLVNYYT